MESRLDPFWMLFKDDIDVLDRYADEGNLAEEGRNYGPGIAVFFIEPVESR